MDPRRPSRRPGGTTPILTHEGLSPAPTWASAVAPVRWFGRGVPARVGFGRLSRGSRTLFYPLLLHHHEKSERVRQGAVERSRSATDLFSTLSHVRGVES